MALEALAGHLLVGLRCCWVGPAPLGRVPAPAQQLTQLTRLQWLICWHLQGTQGKEGMTKCDQCVVQAPADFQRSMEL